MKRLLFVGSLVMLAWSNDAEAISGTCFAGGLPASPTPPVVGAEVLWDWGVPDRYRIDVWRVACQDGTGVALLLRATPITPDPFVCGGSLTLLQNGMQIQAALRQTQPSEFCGELGVATTFSLERQSSSGPAFDNTLTFTLGIAQGTAGHTTLYVPGNGPASELSIQVIVTGCNPCKVGDFAKVHLHVTNPGPAGAVEVKAGSRFPDGVTNFVFLGRYVELEIPSGESDIDIPGLVLPAELPFGTYTIEAALLEPDFGRTLARHSVTAALDP